MILGARLYAFEVMKFFADPSRFLGSMMYCAPGLCSVKKKDLPALGHRQPLGSSHAF
jgi:hypothetical protein